MKLGHLLGIACAILVHAAFILFGGWLFTGLKKDRATLQQVELLSAEDEAEKEKEKPKDATPEESTEELETEAEEPPDADE